jgi:hypothetical protein
MLIYRIAWWTGIAAGGAGVLAAYFDHWRVAVGLGLLAVICALFGLRELRKGSLWG